MSQVSYSLADDMVSWLERLFDVDVIYIEGVYVVTIFD